MDSIPEQLGYIFTKVDLAETGTVAHAHWLWFVKVFKIVSPNGDLDYWTTNALQISELQQLQLAEFA